MKDNLPPGSRIRHPKFGEGIIFHSDLETYKVFFREAGDKDISKDYAGLEVIQEADSAGDRLTLEEVQSAMVGVLERFADLTMIIPMGDRWRGGKMILQPASKDQKPKEIPIETFFHKIVMVRDRLRVLEQNINSHPKLSDEEKVQLQQYITRVYGSLTTFNILFRRPEDHFVGEGGKE